jgi:hypothetical protein
MSKKHRPSVDGEADVRWYNPTHMAQVLADRYQPSFKRQIQVMIPVSKIINFFKRRKK